MIPLISLLFLFADSASGQDICTPKNNISEERVIMPHDPEYFFKPIPPLDGYVLKFHPSFFLGRIRRGPALLGAVFDNGLGGGFAAMEMAAAAFARDGLRGNNQSRNEGADGDQCFHGNSWGWVVNTGTE
jgi:hypothetical protein